MGRKADPLPGKRCCWGGEVWMFENGTIHWTRGRKRTGLLPHGCSVRHTDGMSLEERGLAEQCCPFLRQKKGADIGCVAGFGGTSQNYGG